MQHNGWPLKSVWVRPRFPTLFPKRTGENPQVTQVTCCYLRRICLKMHEGTFNLRVFKIPRLHGMCMNTPFCRFHYIDNATWLSKSRNVMGKGKGKVKLLAKKNCIKRLPEKQKERIKKGKSGRKKGYIFISNQNFDMSTGSTTRFNIAAKQQQPEGCAHRCQRQCHS